MTARRLGLQAITAVVLASVSLGALAAPYHHHRHHRPHHHHPHRIVR